MRLGFIGLGHLGRAVAGRLTERGHNLTVWNRTKSKAEGVNAEIADSPRSVMNNSDAVFICLFDSNAVRSVLTQENGLLSGDTAGKMIIDLSTNHFREVADFHEACRQSGCAYLESPVLGSVVPASQGNLTALVSGSKEDFDRAESLLQDIASRIFFLGGASMSTKMKLVNNLTLGGFMAVLAEAVSLGESAGIDKKTVLDILSAGGGNSTVLNGKKDKLANDDFSAHFSSALIYKDLQYLQELAFEMKAPMLTGSVVKDIFARTYSAGIEQEDFSAVYKLLKKRS